MKKDLSSYRKSYDRSELSKSELDKNPFKLFTQWFEEVDTEDYKFEANAMTLSTSGLDGFPRNRVVLLKEYDENGFIFYTNYKSQKGKAIEMDNRVCISFFWQQAERQVIIKGTADKISKEKSTAYFHSRPKGSQLGAAVSQQSEVIKDKEVLKQRLLELQNKYSDTIVPKPEEWGGYIIKPIEFEFWQGRPNRLHDRILYQLQDDNSWSIDRLSP